jgi:hypothetical protein
MKHPEDDVSLSDGHGFFVTTAPYARHLRVAKTIKEVSEYISRQYSVADARSRRLLVTNMMQLTRQICFGPI